MPSTTAGSLRFGPQPGPQTDLLKTPADIAIYGARPVVARAGH